MAKVKRPPKIIVNKVHARVVRGPNAVGQWYWQALVYGDATARTIYSAWATREEAARALAGLVERNELDAPAKVATAPVSTVRDLLETWAFTIQERADLGLGAKRHYTSKSRSVARVIGDVRLDRLDLSTLERYRDIRLREPVAQLRKRKPARKGTPGPQEVRKGAPDGWIYTDAGRTSAARTVAKEISILRFAWAWGREMGFCPARDLPKVKVSVQGYVRNHETPTAAESAAVLDGLDGWRRTAVLLLAATGARIGEIAELRWSSVDLAAEEITLRGKTGERVVPIAPDVVAFLRTLPQADGLGVVGVSANMVRSHLRTWIVDACAAAGVPTFTPHGLRRAAADAMLRGGVDVGTAAAFLGHSPQVMLAHYRKATIEDKRAALAKTRLGVIQGGKVVRFGS